MELAKKKGPVHIEKGLRGFYSIAIIRSPEAQCPDNALTIDLHQERKLDKIRPYIKLQGKVRQSRTRDFGLLYLSGCPRLRFRV